MLCLNYLHLNTFGKKKIEITYPETCRQRNYMQKRKKNEDEDGREDKRKEVYTNVPSRAQSCSEEKWDRKLFFFGKLWPSGYAIATATAGIRSSITADRYPCEDLDYAISTAANYPTTILTPDDTANPLAPHEAMTGNFLYACAIVERPKA